jgi:hypothetical protein
VIRAGLLDQSDRGAIVEVPELKVAGRLEKLAVYSHLVRMVLDGVPTWTWLDTLVSLDGESWKRVCCDADRRVLIELDYAARLMGGER